MKHEPERHYKLYCMPHCRCNPEPYHLVMMDQYGIFNARMPEDRGNFRWAMKMINKLGIAQVNLMWFENGEPEECDH